MSTLVLFEGTPARWLRIEGSSVIARGEHPVEAAEGDTRIVAIIPGNETIVHVLPGAGLTDAQARGAARIALADTSVAPVDTLHIAVGPEIDGERVTVAIDTARLTERLATLSVSGLDPDALVPAVLVPPSPEVGFVRAVLGEEAVVRGGGAAFVDDPVLTPILVPEEIVTLDREVTEAAIIAAAANPPVDLRQGIFAKRRTWAADRARLRTILWLAAACLAALLLVPIATLINLTMTAVAIEGRAAARVAAALPPGTVVTNPVAQMDERLGAVGLQNGGLLPLAGAVASAVEAVPGVEVERLVYTGAEGLRVGIRAPNTGDYQILIAKLSASGLTVNEGGTDGAREIVVKRP